MSARVNLLLLDDSLVRGMMADIRFTALVPCLASIARTLEGKLAECNTCSRKKGDARKKAISEAKACLTRLPKVTRDQLKILLNARQLRVKRASTAGTVTITF